MNPIRMMRVRTVTIASAPAFPARVRIAWGGEAPAPRDRSIMDAPERSTLPGRALLGRNEQLGTLAGGIPRTARSRPSLVEFDLEPCAPFLWAGEPATQQKLAYPCGKINSKRVLAHIFAPTLRSGRAASSRRDIITENYSQPIIARAPETVGNERTPSHPYGISLLAPPVSRTDRRRPEPAHRARPGRPRQDPPGRDHVRDRGAASRCRHPRARRSLPARRPGLRPVSRAGFGRNLPPSRRVGKARRGGRAGARVQATLARAEPAPLPGDLAPHRGGAEALRAGRTERRVPPDRPGRHPAHHLELGDADP